MTARETVFTRRLFFLSVLYLVIVALFAPSDIYEGRVTVKRWDAFVEVDDDLIWAAVTFILVLMDELTPGGMWAGVHI